MNITLKRFEEKVKIQTSLNISFRKVPWSNKSINLSSKNMNYD